MNNEDEILDLDDEIEEDLDYSSDNIEDEVDDSAPQSIEAPNQKNNNTSSPFRKGMNPGQISTNQKASKSIQERLQRSRSQNLPRMNSQNRMQQQNSTQDNTKGNQQNGSGMAEKAVASTASTAAQAAGVPKPVADFAANKLAGPMMKAAKKQMLIAVLVPVLVIMIIILVVADIEGATEAESKERSEYLYGSGTEEDLYNYLVQMGYCEDTDSCESSDAAAFYKELKSVLNSTSYLTEEEADVFIIEMIFYNRTEKDAFKQTDEIKYIADIIENEKKAFDINNTDIYKKAFIQEDGYFETYRADELVESGAPIEYKEDFYAGVVKKAKEKSKILKQISHDETTDTLVCSYDIDGVKVSDIKVRLLQCDDDEQFEPIEGEELIDFETYILGVVYAENGNGSTESFKAQAIAARSYALTRGDVMGETLSLRKENGQWILPIRNCTDDQVYCDPDKGCWSNDSYAGGTVHSGYDSTKAYAKKALAADSPIRTAVAETDGKVLVDSSGKILYTAYSQPAQDTWNNGAKEGNDHFELLKLTYPTSSKILSTCNSISINGEYSSWKQYQGSWIGIPLGNSKYTIKSAGCLVTSVAIQIARSGTQITVDNFDPGVFVKHLNQHNGFTAGGNFYWNTPSNSGLTPNFIYQGKQALEGTAATKAQMIKSYEDKGYYIVIYIENSEGGTHWVALDHVEGSNVYIFDPGSSATSLWDKYTVSYVKQIGLYKKTD